MPCPVQGSPITVNQSGLTKVGFTPNITSDMIVVSGLIAPTIRVWLETIKTLTGSEITHGLGSGTEFPSWLDSLVGIPVLDAVLNTWTALVQITIDFALMDEQNTDFVNLGIDVDDGVNSIVQKIICVDFMQN